MSKVFRRLAWVSGSFTVGLSIAEMAYLGHTSKFSEAELKSLHSAQQLQLINGLGLCLCGTRKTRLVILPLSTLIAGSIMFSGVIFYSKTYQDYKFNRLIPYGGGASMVGWALMAIC